MAFGATPRDWNSSDYQHGEEEEDDEDEEDLDESSSEEEDYDEELEILERLYDLDPDWPERTVIMNDLFAEDVSFEVDALYDLENDIGKINEIRAVLEIKNFSLWKNLNLKIFWGVKITSSQVTSLRRAFDVDLKWTEDLEIDVVAISRRRIWLFEVKSSIAQHEKAFAQLDKAEEFLMELLESLDCNDGYPLVKKIFASPEKRRGPPWVPLQYIFSVAENEDVQCLNLDAPEKGFIQLVRAAKRPRTISNFHRLIAAFAFFMTSHSSRQYPRQASSQGDLPNWMDDIDEKLKKMRIQPGSSPNLSSHPRAESPWDENHWHYIPVFKYPPYEDINWNG